LKKTKRKTDMKTASQSICLLMVLLSSLTWAAYETDEPVDFTLLQLGGSEVALSDFRGEWVVVNYWATWCAPCRKEIPDLSLLHDERDDITVLGLAYEELDDSDFYEFLESFNVTYPILKVDVFEPPEPFGAPKALPTTIILDPQGRAVKAFLGPVTREAIEAYVDAAGE
jgi:thiol-disulfide isomerase/thioredoxin